MEQNDEDDDDCCSVPEVTKKTHIKAHQSGVNSIAIDVKIQPGLTSTFRVASGGDDNKISIWEVTSNEAETGELAFVTSRVCDVFGHASQITGKVLII